MDAGTTAREFSIYYGFLEPLQVLDDRALLTRMARLKQRAISPRNSLRSSTTPMSPMTPARSSTTVAAAPASPCGCVTPTSRPTRPARPRTAPAGGRAACTAAACASPAATISGAAPGLGLSPETEAQLVSASGGLTPQQARRERWLREQRARQKREEAKLKKRWDEVDALVTGKRETSFDDAKARVAKIEVRREQAHARVDARVSEKLKGLQKDMEKKEERLAEWRTVQAEQEERRLQEHIATRQRATERFTRGLERRDSGLQLAEERAAARAGAYAAVKRAEIAARSAVVEQRQVEANERRVRAEKALEGKIEQTRQSCERQRQRVESFMQAQRDEGKRSRDYQREARERHSMSPRGDGTFSARPSPRKPKAHEGSTGLEVLKQKCTLCEQEFSALTGVTFLKAIGMKRAEFGDDGLLKWCTKRGLQTMYESASLCVFCCQFFEKGWRE